MSGVLKSLEDVREAMKQLGRELASHNHYFDLNEINRKVAERIEEEQPKLKPGNGLPAASR